MSAIVVDAATREILLSGGRVEIRDESGALIGRAVRVNSWPPAPPAGYEVVGDWPSDEELDRRVREDKRYTIEQVLEHLRGLDNAR